MVLPEHLAVILFVAGQHKHLADLEWLVLTERVRVEEAVHVARNFVGVYGADKLADFAAYTRWKNARLK